CPDGPGGTCPPARCGDGFVWNTDGGSDGCDDGDGVNNDSCPDGVGGTCQPARCGDGHLWTTDGGTETCDDGDGINNDSCPDGPGGTCHAATCGDNHVWNTDGGGEECDAGGESAGCNVNCTTSACGDGMVNATAGEGCDDGDGNNNDSCPDGVGGTCQPATCGDGHQWNMDGGSEQCDDGNPVNSDACLNTCVAASCGDGFVRSGVEGCDDGDGNNNDSCPDGPGGTCQPASCGDTFLWNTDGGSETCDDGNTTPGDGCDGICHLESVCGDGVAEGIEECDGADLNGQSCTTQGFDYGTLTCNAGSCTFNTSSCRNADCSVTEGFESSWPPPGWEVIDNNAYENWEQVLDPHTGTYAAEVTYDYLTPSNEVLISNPFLCSGASCAMTITFWFKADYYYAVTTGDYEVALWVVKGDYDGGPDDIPLTTTIIGDYLTSDADDDTWFQASYAIPASEVGQTIRVAWQYYGLDGFYFTLDDVELTTSFCTNQCGNGTLDPGEGCDDGDQDNSDSCPDGIGGTCQSAFCGDGIAWTTDGGTEECDGSDFTGLTCSDYGYTSGTLTCTGGCVIDSSGCFDTIYYYQQNFDGNCNQNNWTLTGEWECGSPSIVGPPASHSPTRCLGTDLNDYYNPSQTWGGNTATSPAIDLTSATAPMLSWWMWVDMEGGYDGGNLKARIVGAPTWTVVTTVTPAYEELINSEMAWNNGGSYSGQWYQFQANLTAFAGNNIEIRFDYDTDSSVQYAGLYVDDVVVYE
ncbi:MAG: choice-of-anchor J domain-containing protein, partial [bacterium]